MKEDCHKTCEIYSYVRDGFSPRFMAPGVHSLGKMIMLESNTSDIVRVMEIVVEKG